MKKKLLNYFLYILSSIFFFLVTEIQLIDIISKFSLKEEIFPFYLANIMVLIFWSLSLFYFFRLASLIHQEKTARQSDLLQLEESQKLLQTLQSQRHDFRNQLQVINALIQIGKSEEAVTYIDDCVQTTSHSFTLSERINNSAISAMFLVYQSEAGDKGIHFNVDSDIYFAAFHYSPVKITRILGNIIRNALEVLERTTMADRMINVTMWENSEQYTFVVWNNGPPIPERIQSRIFTPGFSTKKSSGLGLYIAKNLTNELGGRIGLTSSETEGTEFRITLPRL